MSIMIYIGVESVAVAFGHLQTYTSPKKIRILLTFNSFITVVKTLFA